MRKRTILLADDSDINRKILCKILGKEYKIIEAENGSIALEILKKQFEDISLILLDIMMPVMNGYEVLDAIRVDARLSLIPVIIETSSENSEDEIKCLTQGASDFITKPYNPDVIKHRISSIIRLRESAAIINMLETDRTTGLYSKEFFYQYAARMIQENPNQEYDMVCCDVVKFKIINERYGINKGNKVLQFIAAHLTTVIKDSVLCGYLGSDKFAVLCPHQDISEAKYTRLNNRIKKLLAEAPVSKLDIKFGVYLYVDKSIPISRMCDRASFALNKIKGIYDTYIAEYDDSIRISLLREQRISDEMDQALIQGQFKVYYQPQHEIKDNRLSGAEALVRWEHPEYGIIPPCDFIPIFERNGFITKLDDYVWEEVCKKLHERKEDHLPVVPISVNVSRADFESTDLVERFKQLTRKYDIEPELLPLELTETMYTENPQQIIDTVNRLRKNGFKVEMDDFGSGYSSLSMLSELTIDVLKIDMKFVQQADNEQKKSILSFVVALSKWLNLDMIAEGVETEEQMSLLRAVGCQYVQGFYYSKPIPSKEFDLYFEKWSEKIIQPISELKPLANQKINSETKKTILIVEDLETNRELLKIMLDKQYNVREAENGIEALKFLQNTKETVALILLDLVMPVMDGFELIKELKNNKEYTSIPIVITSEIGKDSELRALRLGASDFVAKPYEKDILLHHVGCAIDCAEYHSLKAKMTSQI